MKTLKRLNVLIVILIFLVIFSFYKFQKEIFYFKNQVKILNLNNKNISENQNIKHKIFTCLENNNSPEKAEKDYLKNSKEKDGLKSLISCFNNKYFFKNKNDDNFFVIWDSVNNIKYFISNYTEYYDKFILVNLVILGKKDNFIFYKYCYEGCSDVKFIDTNKALNKYENGNQKIILTQEENLNLLYRQNLDSESYFIFYKNKIFFISKNKIWEFNPKDFFTKKLKEINQDKAFGLNDVISGDFIPIYTEKENGLLIKIYKNNTSYDSEEDIENKNIDSYFLEIK